MIGRLKCWWTGKHLRGKRIESLDNGATKRFQFSRCGRVTSYKAKA